MTTPHHQALLGLIRAGLTRRSLMRGGLGFAAAAAIPSYAGAGNEDISPVMTKLSSYMSEASNRALPSRVLDQTKYHVLDTLAAMISGSELPPGRQALQFAHA